jgi:HEAT repeat protein
LDRLAKKLMSVVVLAAGALFWSALLFADHSIDFVFDLDKVLIYEIKDPKTIASLSTSAIYLDSVQEHYRVVKGATEMIESLLKIPGARVSFFSAGLKVRNHEVLKKIKLRDGRSFFDIAHKVLSVEDVVVSQARYAAEWNIPLSSVDPQAVSLNPRFQGKFHKDLRRVLGDAGLDSAILVDDNIQFAYRGQEKNLLYLKELSQGLTAKEALTDIPLSHQDEFANLLKNKGQAEFADLHKLARARGLIELALKRSREKNIPLNEALWQIQWRQTPTGPVYQTGLIANSIVYEIGEQKFKEVSLTGMSKTALSGAIESRITRVEEFKALREICAKLKVRCWLFGGTAAGYAHYVKWDLLRESGDPRFQPDRFDYDYTNIFRSTQDADLVIDGTVEQAEKIENILRERFKHFQGSKPIWEVRLLKESRGEKEALLNNPNFLNQHTDSNSTGMIEVTKSAQGESAIRDLRDWTPRAGRRPIFFEDIYQSKLHYYFSPAHAATNRAAKGLNPPILSVIRYLTKAFQYELEIQPDDLVNIKKVIDDFDPGRDVQLGYLKNWIEKNGKKLIQHAVNIEYAWNTLEELGLRRKLAQMGDQNVQDSMAWWMSKEPLRSKPLGQGTGKTARELEITIVAHETKDFLAYESITRAHTGDPNVLISRNNTPGESAAYGDGFYTAIGREGARETGFTIRFTVDPNAREGEDFVLNPIQNQNKGRHVIFMNKNALKVIPESLNITPLEFFKMLASTEQFDLADRAIIEKVKRRIGNRLATNRAKQLREIEQVIRSALTSNKLNLILIDEYFGLHATHGGLDPVTIRATWSRILEMLLMLDGEGKDKELYGKFYAFINKWKPQEPWVVQKLLTELESKNSWRRRNAIYALCAIQVDTPGLVTMVIDAIQSEKDKRVLAGLITFLGQSKSDDARAVPEIFKALRHFNKALRRAAASALGNKTLRGGQQARDILNLMRRTSMVGDDWFLIQRPLMDALLRFSKDDDGALVVLRDAAQDLNLVVREKAIHILTEHMEARDPKTIRVLLKGLTSRNIVIKLCTIDAFSVLKPQDKEVALALARIIRSDPWYPARGRALHALYAIGPTDDQAILTLLKNWKKAQFNYPEARVLWKVRHVLPDSLQQYFRMRESMVGAMRSDEESLVDYIVKGANSPPEVDEAIKFYETKLAQQSLQAVRCVKEFLKNL